MSEKSQQRLNAMWLSVLDDLWWAETFHWPPQVVDDMGFDEARRLMFVTLNVKAGRQKREADDAKRNR